MINSRIAALMAAVAVATVVAAPPARAAGLFAAARGALFKRALMPKVRPAPPAGKPRDVVIERSKYPQAAENIEHAQRNGQPTVLHIDREGAAARRSASTGGVSLKTKPAPRYERDEYPPAMTREGGHNANVRYISAHDNRGAGSSMRNQTRDLPDGSKIRIVVGE